MAVSSNRSLRWMTAFSVWLFLTMTAAMVATKVSLLWLLRLYKYEQIHPATWYVLMLVLLEVPLVCHVIHIVWNTPFINGPRTALPKKSVLLLGAMGSVMESAAGAVFATELSYVLPEPVLLLLPAAVFTVHLVLVTSRNVKAKTGKDFECGLEKTSSLKDKSGTGMRSWLSCLAILMSSYLLWAPAAVATVLHVWSPFNMGLGACLTLTPAILVLSATWAPQLQNVLITAKASKGQEEAKKNSTLGLIYALFRMGTIPLTLYLIMFFKVDAFRRDVTHFLQHVRHDVTDLRVWLPVFVASGSGLCSLVIGGVASKVALLTPGMRIPALVTPVISLAAATVLWHDVESEAIWELSGCDVMTWTASVVALLAWLIPFVIPGVKIIRASEQLLRPFSENFHSFTWRPFFLEPHLMLNTKADEEESDPMALGQSRGPKVSRRTCGVKRVYVCTTMYRETESEMRRYLTSLRKAFSCPDLQDVELEVHIFLDNCVEEDRTLNAHGRQLLRLVQAELQAMREHLHKYATPYGCQVRCRCPGGHLLYVHCKDGREFKAKKRWSQVMYINYILHHRATTPRGSAPGIGQDSTAQQAASDEDPTQAAPAQRPQARGHPAMRQDEGERDGNQGNVWFTAGQELLPEDCRQALQRLFDHSDPGAAAIPVTRLGVSGYRGDGPSRDSRQNARHYESGSESAACSSGHGAGSYAVTSLASTTGSDTDDDSDHLFTFCVAPKGSSPSSSRCVISAETSTATECESVASLDAGRDPVRPLAKDRRLQGGRSLSVSGSEVGGGVPIDAKSRKSRVRSKNGGRSQTLASSRESGKGGHYAAGIKLWEEFEKRMTTPPPPYEESPRSLSTTPISATPLCDPLHLATEDWLRGSLSAAGSDVTEDVYILATDADTEFDGASVRTLLDVCEADRTLGAVCGRTTPVGGARPVVWYQKFEYAKDFWLVKSSQNAIGSVTCCPGCFSLYRSAALRDVIEAFSQPSLTAYDTLVKDHGEDRWLCTLMMQKGWKLEYTDQCRNSTHCPETCGEFLRQRRRWVLSELANMVLIFQGLGQLVKGNVRFSTIFVLSLVHMFVWVLLSPATTLVVVCVALHVLFALPLLYSAPVAYGLLLGYFAVCVTQPPHTQRLVTQAILAVVMGIVLAVAAGFVEYVVETLKKDLWEGGAVQFQPYLLVLLLVASTLYAALLHASEGLTLLYGLVYAAIFPAMFLTLPVYSVANMVDTSWGTRELQGTRACCDVMVDEVGDGTNKDEKQEEFSTSQLPSLRDHQPAEDAFWAGLKERLLGCHVNQGGSERHLRADLLRLRNRCAAGLLGLNSAWFAALTCLYLSVSSDVVCYVIAAVFSFSLAVQLVGMTSYKAGDLLRRYVLARTKGAHSGAVWVMGGART